MGRDTYVACSCVSLAEFQVSNVFLQKEERRRNERRREKYTVKLEWVEKKKLKGREKDQSDDAGRLVRIYRIEDNVDGSSVESCVE